MVEAGTSSSKKDITGVSTEAERNKLVFFEGGYKFRFGGLVEGFDQDVGGRDFVQGGAGGRDNGGDED